MSGHVVGDQRDVDLFLLQFPRRQPRTLQIRPRLVSENGHAFSCFDGGSHYAKRRAVAGGGESAGVAMRQDRRRFAEEHGTVAADALVRFDILGEHRLRLGREIPARVAGAQHPVERPHQIDGRRTRRAQLDCGGIDVVTALCRQRDAEGGRDADGWRAAHDHVANRDRHFMRIAAGNVANLPRQQALIEKLQRLAAPSNRFNLHGVRSERRWLYYEPFPEEQWSG